MPLTKCSDCGKEISDAARFCIHCGKPRQAEQAVSHPPTGADNPDLQPCPRCGSTDVVSGVITLTDFAGEKCRRCGKTWNKKEWAFEKAYINSVGVETANKTEFLAKLVGLGLVAAFLYFSWFR